MKLFILFLFAAAVLSVQSCGYCTTCVSYPKDTIKLCKKDFASEDSYAQAFRQLTYDGYDCR